MTRHIRYSILVGGKEVCELFHPAGSSTPYLVETAIRKVLESVNIDRNHLGNPRIFDLLISFPLIED